jgi:hypothetical protein
MADEAPPVVGPIYLAPWKKQLSYRLESDFTVMAGMQNGLDAIETAELTICEDDKQTMKDEVNRREGAVNALMDIISATCDNKKAHKFRHTLTPLEIVQRRCVCDAEVVFEELVKEAKA